MKYSIRVYDWEPNGTNTISIVNSNSPHDTRCEDSMEGALFGVDITKVGKRYDAMSSTISLETALKHISVSPVSDGSETINFLKRYFRSSK